MDEYIAKPIARQALLALVDGAAPAPAPAVHAQATGALLERLGGDEALAREVTLMFFDDAEALLGAVRDAVHSGSSDAICRAAHALKGVVSNFEEASATATAREIERLAAGGTVDAAAALLPALEAQLALLMTLLAAPAD